MSGRVTDRMIHLYVIVKTRGWRYRQTRHAWNVYKKHLARAGLCGLAVPAELQTRLRERKWPFDGTVKNARNII